ncbi:alpha/beta fold hydrolase [Granulicella sp. dw_53]|uniref:alpha/beta hydrolase n=1 Tax=Granulicella sp. dw_53 TaxID=2719792 RepID=UPI001BD30A30|nr:alpha/beta fold hydrolase [Granulicella sp. dw_53]
MATEQRKLRSLSWMLTAISRGLILRDRLRGITRGLRRHDARQEYFITSGTRKLSCVYVPGIEAAPAVLLCHGIGETVEHWSAVQALLRDHDIGSLIFNYSGYGKSSGRVRAEHCDEDLVTAYTELRRQVGAQTPVFVLGFSLGSGIAAHGIAALHPPPAGLFLCEAFDSFREAASAAGLPRRLARMLPDVWVTVANMEQVQIPVWVIHSDGDRLFPLEMPRKIAKACGQWGELIVLEGFTHNEPILTASETYWQPIIERIKRSTAIAESKLEGNS